MSPACVFEGFLFPFCRNDAMKRWIPQMPRRVLGQLSGGKGAIEL